MKFNLKLIILVTLVAGTMACNEQAGADGYTLKFNMKKGDSFDYTMNMDMTMKQEMMGQQVDVSTAMQMGYLFEVTGDSAGWKQVSATISKVAMDMNAGGMQIKVDSDDPATDSTNPMGIVGKVFGAMKGGQFSFTINEKGEVGAVTGMKEMMQRIIQNSGIDNPDMMMASFGKSFDEQQFRQNLQQSFSVYPDKPVKPGDTWKRTLNMNNNGVQMKLDNTYTLVGVNGDDAELKVASVISSDADSSSVMGMQVEMNGTMDGNMHYLLESGLPQQGTMDMNMNMKMTGEGMDVPMDMKMKMNFSAKKK